MLHQKGFQSKLLHFGPTVLAAHLCRNFARRNSFHQGGYSFEQLAGVPEKSWCYSVGDECDEDQESDISFQNMWSSQVLEKEGMTLEKPDNGIDQICEQYGKRKNHDDSPSDIHDSEHNCKEQDCQKYVGCAAIGECHMSPPVYNGAPKISRFWSLISA